MRIPAIAGPSNVESRKMTELRVTAFWKSARGMSDG